MRYALFLEADKVVLLALQILGIRGDSALSGLEALLLHVRLRIGLLGTFTRQGELRCHLETLTGLKSFDLTSNLGVFCAQRLDKLCHLLALVLRPVHIAAQAHHTTVNGILGGLRGQVFRGGQARSDEGEALASTVHAIGGIVRLLDTLNLTLNGINALNRPDDTRGGFAGYLAQRHLEIIVYTRKAQLRAQIRTTQDK